MSKKALGIAALVLATTGAATLGSKPVSIIERSGTINQRGELTGEILSYRVCTVPKIEQFLSQDSLHCGYRPHLVLWRSSSYVGHGKNDYALETYNGQEHGMKKQWVVPVPDHTEDVGNRVPPDSDLGKQIVEGFNSLGSHFSDNSSRVVIVPSDVLKDLPKVQDGNSSN